MPIGDKYFFIPDLERHRGASHVFVFKLDGSDARPQESLQLARRFATAAIDTCVLRVS